jgi:protoporphyrin/coproporphyrin ferrochelatase
MTAMAYDAFLLVSFGGPEGPDDVMPFLRNVTRGRGIPDERLAEVATHYQHFGGVSPINGQCRELLAAIGAGLGDAGIDLPIYWGNRNWTPYLADTVRQMRDDGVRRALAFVTSPYGSFSSCRQYLDDIATARATVGPDAPIIDKIRHYHDHPGHIRAHVDAVGAALATLPAERRATTRIAFTAHSIPVSMAAASGPGGGTDRYRSQLREVAALVTAEAAADLGWDLVWQSRSGPPQVPWLEPDINHHLRRLADDGVTSVLVSPIGFISDHLEVAWDLDHEAAETAKELGLDFVRAATPGVHPSFVDMIMDLVGERLDPKRPRAALGRVPTWDSCPADCCRPPARPGRSDSHMIH